MGCFELSIVIQCMGQLVDRLAQGWDHESR
jgi:hypothetical protein